MSVLVEGRGWSVMEHSPLSIVCWFVERPRTFWTTYTTRKYLTSKRHMAGQVIFWSKFTLCSVGYLRKKMIEISSRKSYLLHVSECWPQFYLASPFWQGLSCALECNMKVVSYLYELNNMSAKYWDLVLFIAWSKEDLCIMKLLGRWNIEWHPVWAGVVGEIESWWSTQRQGHFECQLLRNPLLKSVIWLYKSCSEVKWHYVSLCTIYRPTGAEGCCTPRKRFFTIIG